MIERAADARTKAVLEAAFGARYGPPDEHWEGAVGAINALYAHKLREPLVPEDWGVFLMVAKLARETHPASTKPH